MAQRHTAFIMSSYSKACPINRVKSARFLPFAAEPRKVGGLVVDGLGGT